MGKEDVVVRRKESRAGREDDGCRWQVATTVDVVCVRRQDWDKTLRGHGGCRGLLQAAARPSLAFITITSAIVQPQSDRPLRPISHICMQVSYSPAHTSQDAMIYS